MKPQGYVPASASPSAHEASDLHIPLILRIAAILGVTLIVSLLLLALFFKHLEQKYGRRTSEAVPEVTSSELPPAPTLQMHPRLDLQEVRAVEDSHLDEYGWVDRPHGVARIPVDRAMVLWVQNYAATSPPSAPPGNSASALPAAAPGKATASKILPGSATNTAPASGMTELQMRQQKAQEAPHAP